MRPEDGTMWGYELWDTETGNLISSFSDEGGALRSAAAIVRDFGPSGLAAVALVRVDADDEDGAVAHVAAGNELLARVGQAA